MFCLRVLFCYLVPTLCLWFIMSLWFRLVVCCLLMILLSFGLMGVFCVLYIWVLGIVVFDFVLC